MRSVHKTGETLCQRHYLPMYHNAFSRCVLWRTQGRRSYRPLVVGFVVLGFVFVSFRRGFLSTHPETVHTPACSHTFETRPHVAHHFECLRPGACARVLWRRHQDASTRNGVQRVVEFRKCGNTRVCGQFRVCGKKTAAKRNKNETENNKTHDERTIRPTALCAPEDAPGRKHYDTWADSVVDKGSLPSYERSACSLIHVCLTHRYFSQASFPTTCVLATKIF